MKRSFWITLFVSVSTAAVAMMAIDARNKNLSGRLATEQARSETVNDQKGASTPADPTTPGQRIELATEAIKALAATLPPESDDYEQQQLEEKEFRKIVPDLLGSVEGLSADELIAVAREMPDSSRARTFLVMLAAEQDPERVLGEEGLVSGMSSLEMLGALARTDPATALRRLPPMTPEKIENRRSNLIGKTELSARIQYATQLLSVDFDQGMAALQEVHRTKSCIPVGVMGSFGIPTVPENSIPGLIDAMGRPEYAGMREDLRELTVMSTLVNHGVDQVTRHVGAMDLSPEELGDTIEDLMRMNVMTSEPEPMLAWLEEVQPHAMGSAFAIWADQDMVSATDWLGQQAPSPQRDKMISGFSPRAAELDRQSAIKWANEIQDKNLRDRTLKAVSQR